jgi:hypothetical protein
MSVYTRQPDRWDGQKTSPTKRFSFFALETIAVA